MDLLLTFFRVLVSWLMGRVPELGPVLVRWHGAGGSGTCQIDPPWVVSPLLDRIAAGPPGGTRPAWCRGVAGLTCYALPWPSEFVSVAWSISVADCAAGDPQRGENRRQARS